MASANVTLPGANSYAFEVDTNAKTATLTRNGGKIFNQSAETVWINTVAGTVSTSAAAGMSLPIAQNQTYQLPSGCTSFTFKTAANSAFPVYTPV